MNVSPFPSLATPREDTPLAPSLNNWTVQVSEREHIQAQKARNNFVKVLVHLLNHRIPYLIEHNQRVSVYTRWLGEALGWATYQLQIADLGAQLHDIGKSLLPEPLLKKTGPLSEEEWALMRQHPENGVNIIRNLPFLSDTLPFIYTHHEKWDGTGYPRGCKGTEIPLEGRILALADVFDALTSARPYRAGWSISKVLQIIGENAGTHFDPDLVPIFIKIIENKLEVEPLPFVPSP